MSFWCGSPRPSETKAKLRDVDYADGRDDACYEGVVIAACSRRVMMVPLLVRSGHGPPTGNRLPRARRLKTSNSASPRCQRTAGPCFGVKAGAWTLTVEVPAAVQKRVRLLNGLGPGRAVVARRDRHRDQRATVLRHLRAGAYALRVRTAAANEESSATGSGSLGRRVPAMRHFSPGVRSRLSPHAVHPLLSIRRPLAVESVILPPCPRATGATSSPHAGHEYFPILELITRRGIAQTGPRTTERVDRLLDSN